MSAIAEDLTPIDTLEDADDASRLAEDMGLHEYAALCVEIAEAPEKRAAALAEFKTTEDEFSAVDGYWRARFAEDATLQRDYRRLYDTQRSQLRLLRRRGGHEMLMKR